MSLHTHTTFIPTLDISNGKCVLMEQGKIRDVLGDAYKHAEFLSIHNHFQVVDIDAALGTGNNRELIKEITKKFSCYVGGGIRTYDDAIAYLNSSARRVIIASVPDLVKSFPKDRVILAVDLDEKNTVLIKGRTEAVGSFEEFLPKYAQYIEMMTITFHYKEGTCSGIPIDHVKKIKEFIDKNGYAIKLVCAGGITNVDEILQLSKLGVVAQFGSGFWKGSFTLGDIFSNILNNNKQKKYSGDPVIYPCVVQNSDGIILGIVYMTPEALKLSVDTRIAVFHSRDTNNLWIKGATSTNYQRVLHVNLNCDNTAIRMIVDNSHNNFCHLRQLSCFGHGDPARGNLQSISSHLMQIISDSAHSPSRALINDPNKIRTKLREEINELICSDGRNEIIHETADVLYFLLMFLRSFDVGIGDIEAEMIKRRYVLKQDKFDVRIREAERFKIGIVTAVDTQPIIDYLAGIFKMKITHNGNPRSYTYICSNENVQLIPVKAKDIPLLINNNYLDAVVSYYDIIKNYYVNVSSVHLTSTEHKSVSVVVAGNANMTIESLQLINKTRKLIIMAEYMGLVGEWLKKHNLHAKVENVNGSSESYLVSGLCDLAVMICDSGTTLSANNLIIVETLLTTSMQLFVANDKLDKLKKLGLVGK